MAAIMLFWNYQLWNKPSPQLRGILTALCIRYASDETQHRNRGVTLRDSGGFVTWICAVSPRVTDCPVPKKTKKRDRTDSNAGSAMNIDLEPLRSIRFLSPAPRILSFPLLLFSRLFPSFRCIWVEGDPMPSHIERRPKPKEPDKAKSIRPSPRLLLADFALVGFCFRPHTPCQI
jgi:hypothetical protein